MDNDRILSSLLNHQNNSAYQQPQLHSFCLPNELIQSIEPLKVHDPTTIYQTQPISSQPKGPKKTQSASDDDDQKPERLDPTQKLLNFSCTICRVRFDSNDLQRQHFRSDWHSFNLKSIGSSKSPITEEAFINLLEKLEDSLSGSDSESDSNSMVSDQSDDSKGFQSSSWDNHQIQKSGQPTLQDKLDRLLLDPDHHESSRLDSSSKPEINLSQLLSSRSPIVWFALIPNSLGIQNQDQHGFDSTDREDSKGIVQLGFYRSIFPKTFLLDRGPSTTHHQLGDQYKSELSSLQKPFLPSNSSESSSHPPIQQPLSPIWTIFMIGGGHFAAMVVSALPKLRHVGKHKPPEMEQVILHHKTFHRYTTRRKQGGGQATHDAGGKGAAKSAGANLRRYNEQSLAQDIQSLMKSWSDSIQASELIFIRSSKSNLKIFLKSKSNPQADNDLESYKLNRGDSRIRSLPFVTKRPTFNELKRCFTELTRVKIIKMTEREIRDRETELKLMLEREQAKIELDLKKRQEQKDRAKEEEAERKRREELKLKSKEDEPLISRWERIIDLVQKGKLEALKEFINKHGDQTQWFETIPIDLIPESARNGCVTLLQIASLSDQSELIEWMLIEGRCDPTIKGEKGVGRSTAYELAASKSTRNSFRRVMAKEPTLWDWVGLAKVPSGLTEEMEAQQATRGKDRKQKLKEKLKDRDRLRNAEQQEKLRAQAELELAAKLQREEEGRIRRLQSTSVVNRLGGSTSANSQTRKTNVLNQSIGLTDDQRLRLERERRARAAEARLK